jgi:hypothetical protein
MWLLLIPLVILLVLVFAATAVLGAVFALVGQHWPWLLIGLGVLMLWKNDRPGRRVARAQRREMRPAPIAIADKRQPQKQQQPPAPRTAELPIDVQVKVEQIRRKVDVLLSYADRFPPFSKDLYLVRQTASEYLPRTIEAFLKLPAKPVNGDRASVVRELKAQLDLLDSKLDEIASDLQRQDMDRLLANRRFLEERFGRASA